MMNKPLFYNIILLKLFSSSKRWREERGREGGKEGGGEEGEGQEGGQEGRR